jgi:hypothetical protein
MSVALLVVVRVVAGFEEAVGRGDSVGRFRAEQQVEQGEVVRRVVEAGLEVLLVRGQDLGRPVCLVW